MYLDNTQKLKMRTLCNDYKIFVSSFSYNFIERLKKELPYNLDPVYFRAFGREDKTNVIHIEKSGKIIACSFLLCDRTIPSPGWIYAEYQ